MRKSPAYRTPLIAWIAVIALGLHGLIPAGYMPDFSGHGMLVACDGVSHMGHMHHGGHGDHAGHDVCPFSVGAAYSFDDFKTPLIAPPVFARTALLIPALSLPARQMVFGNASPRSPPFLS